MRPADNNPAETGGSRGSRDLAAAPARGRNAGASGLVRTASPLHIAGASPEAVPLDAREARADALEAVVEHVVVASVFDRQRARIDQGVAPRVPRSAPGHV